MPAPKNVADYEGGPTGFHELYLEARAEFLAAENGEPVPLKTPKESINVTAAFQALLSKMVLIANAKADEIAMFGIHNAVEFNHLITLVKSAQDLSDKLALPIEDQK